KFVEGGVDVEQFGGLGAFGAGGDPGPRKNKRNARRSFPERVLTGDSLFAEMPAMIAPNDDDGVVVMPALFQGLEDATDLRVHETDASEVRASEVAPLIVVADPLQPRLRQVPVKIPGEARRVVAVVVAHRRQQGLVVGIEIEPTLSRVTWDVR